MELRSITFEVKNVTYQLSINDTWSTPIEDINRAYKQEILFSDLLENVLTTGL
jgi:hypothetical protein